MTIKLRIEDNRELRLVRQALREAGLRSVLDQLPEPERPQLTLTFQTIDPDADLEECYYRLESVLSNCGLEETQAKWDDEDVDE